MIRDYLTSLPIDSERTPYQPRGYTYALRRSEILGAFFNACFLLALAVSIVLQAIDRFVNLPEVDDPFSVMIVGCIGFALNVCSIFIVHGEVVLLARYLRMINDEQSMAIPTDTRTGRRAETSSRMIRVRRLLTTQPEKLTDG